MSVRLTSKSSSGSVRGPGSGSSSVTRMSTVHTSGSYKSPSVHGSKFMGSSYGAGGLGCGSAGNLGSGLGGAGGFGYGSAGGFGSAMSSGFSGSSFASGSDNVINVSEKETMQILNDRLANYLDKVRSLEQENAQLERKIREWYEKQAPYTSPDFDPFFKAIEDLQGKILQGNAANASLLLQIDNARLASDDFRTKYENEAALRMGVEADISGLKRVQDELALSKKDLEMQYQNMTDELAFLKKNHEEEVNSLRSQLGTKVNVEVDAAPAVDLNKMLGELRTQYETIMEQNAKEAERWFIEKSEELNHQMTSSAQQLQTHSTEIIQLRHTLQNLEIELQTQISLRCALENSLAETEARYSSTLTQLQELINDVEMKLSELRCDLERQNFEYKTLLDVKTHLEMEIATYRQLLDSEDSQRGGGYASRGGAGASASRGGSGASITMVSSGGSMNMGGSGGSTNMGGSAGSGSMTNVSSGRPRTIVEDGYNQTKRE